MSSLLGLQQAIKSSMLSKAPPPDALLDAIVDRGDLAPEQRLQIHANNYRASLTDALLTVFPVMTAFVGEVFMRGLLGEYIKTVPPTSACLNEYGHSLAGFIEGYEDIAHLPYLADLCRLEWAVYDVQNGPDGQPLEEGGLGPENICLNRAHAVIQSPYPVLGLWMVGTGQLPPESVHLDDGGQTAVVVKYKYAVNIFSLEGEVQEAFANLVNGALELKDLSDAMIDEFGTRGLLTGKDQTQ